uniref:Uncharacterized protein n=1 Tax=Cyclophora tenuis TaxID=216820 RepID=A0A7S1D330_CYCTE|mmetsp:Transcript_18817/g.32176  ORF Transcript_18817/g.32176 Transcript_18817/m.32176 type:complete len:165 (+) Transcript_18817:836-1330(+)
MAVLLFLLMRHHDGIFTSLVGAATDGRFDDDDDDNNNNSINSMITPRTGIGMESSKQSQQQQQQQHLRSGVSPPVFRNNLFSPSSKSIIIDTNKNSTTGMVRVSGGGYAVRRKAAMNPVDSSRTYNATDLSSIVLSIIRMEAANNSKVENLEEQEQEQEQERQE